MTATIGDTHGTVIARFTATATNGGGGVTLLLTVSLESGGDITPAGQT